MKKDDIEKLNTSTPSELLSSEELARCAQPRVTELLNNTAERLGMLSGHAFDMNSFLSSSLTPLDNEIQAVKGAYNLSAISESLRATANLTGQIQMEEIRGITSSSCGKLSDFIQNTDIRESVSVMMTRFSDISDSLQHVRDEIMETEHKRLAALLSQLLSAPDMEQASATFKASLKLNEIMNDDAATKPAILLTESLAQQGKVSVWDEIRNITDVSEFPLSPVMEGLSPMFNSLKCDFAILDNSDIITTIERTLTLGERIRNFFSNIGTKIRDAIRSIKERISSAIIRFWRDATEIREVLFRFIQEKVFSALHRPRLPSRLSGVIKSVLRSPAVSVSGAEHVLDIKFSDYLTRLLFVFLCHRQMGEDPAHEELCFC